MIFDVIWTKEYIILFDYDYIARVVVMFKLRICSVSLHTDETHGDIKKNIASYLL